MVPKEHYEVAFCLTLIAARSVLCVSTNYMFVDNAILETCLSLTVCILICIFGYVNEKHRRIKHMQHCTWIEKTLTDAMSTESDLQSSHEKDRRSTRQVIDSLEAQNPNPNPNPNRRL